jgi:hypothetical protein
LGRRRRRRWRRRRRRPTNLTTTQHYVYCRQAQSYPVKVSSLLRGAGERVVFGANPSRLRPSAAPRRNRRRAIISTPALYISIVCVRIRAAATLISLQTDALHLISARSQIFAPPPKSLGLLLWVLYGHRCISPLLQNIL